MATKKTRTKSKKKEKKIVSHGIMTINSTFNNTVIAITDPDGNVLTWCAGGVVGFKGSRKSTPFAAQLAARDGMVRIAQHLGDDAVFRVGGKEHPRRNLAVIEPDGQRPGRRRVLDLAAVEPHRVRRLRNLFFSRAGGLDLRLRCGIG